MPCPILQLGMSNIFVKVESACVGIKKKPRFIKQPAAAPFALEAPPLLRYLATLPVLQLAETGSLAACFGVRVFAATHYPPPTIYHLAPTCMWCRPLPTRYSLLAACMWYCLPTCCQDFEKCCCHVIMSSVNVCINRIGIGVGESRQRNLLQHESITHLK